MRLRWVSKFYVITKKWYTENMKNGSKVVRLPRALGEKKYKGKHLLMVKGKVVAAGKWEKVSRAFDQVIKEGKTPTLAYVPKADSLILMFLDRK